jgi:hypothetical protein
MTFVADDAALATGDGGFSVDAIGCGRQLGKPAAESNSRKASAEHDTV